MGLTVCMYDVCTTEQGTLPSRLRQNGHRWIASYNDTRSTPVITMRPDLQRLFKGKDGGCGWQDDSEDKG